MMKRLFLVALLAGCTESQPIYHGGPYGSQALAASDRGEQVFVVDPEEGALAILDLGFGTSLRVDLDGRPTRIARSGGRLFVSLRADRRVVVLSETGVLEGEIATSAEPYGIVALGERLYIACALGAEVLEVDATTLAILRTWPVAGEPRWLAIHPSGSSLYVASARDGIAHRIDLVSDAAEPEPIELPSLTADVYGAPVEYARRITGDPTVTPDGRLLVPMVFLNNVTPISDLTEAVVYYGALSGSSLGASGIEPAVVVVNLDAAGLPIPDSAQVISMAASLIGGYPSSVVVSPSGDTLVVPMEAARAVVLSDLRPSDELERHRVRQPDGPVQFSGTANFGFEPAPTSAVRVEPGASAAAFTDDDMVVVYSFLTRSIRRFTPSALIPGPASIWDARPVHEVAGRRVEVMQSVLSEQIQRGRQLFYDTNPELTRPGLSCALCHFDGRDDGVTWSFTKGLRQTLSLSGEMAMTGPYRWEGERASVAENARLTSVGMGYDGTGMSEEDALAVSAFVDRIPSPDTRRRGSDEDLVAQGRAIFGRADVGCASCHSGPAYTDNLVHPMLHLEKVQTPSLIGVSASAPYFHDGSSRTLGEVLERAKGGFMGNTSSLTVDELRALEAFLESL